MSGYFFLLPFFNRSSAILSISQSLISLHKFSWGLVFTLLKVRILSETLVLSIPDPDFKKFLVLTLLEFSFLSIIVFWAIFSLSFFCFNFAKYFLFLILFFSSIFLFFLFCFSIDLWVLRAALYFFFFFIAFSLLASVIFKGAVAFRLLSCTKFIDFFFFL